MYELTMFKSRFDNKTHKKIRLESWTAFSSFLRNLSVLPKESKSDAELISPAIYEDGTTRSNNHVEYWGSWAAVDVDDVDVGTDGLMEFLCDRLGDWRFIVYSTASSRVGTPKFRVVFDLVEPLPKERIRHFWYALNTAIGEIGDVQTKDLSRMYYVPAKYASADNFIFQRDGNPIDVDDLLARFPYNERVGTSFLDRLPPALAEQVIAHRKNRLDNTDVVWSSYSDCPFWPKRLAVEYTMINDTGWYRKMYQIMVAVAAKAVSREYPITARQIAEMCRQFDNETGQWYANRPLEVEADRAVEYVYRNI